MSKHTKQWRMNMVMPDGDTHRVSSGERVDVDIDTMIPGEFDEIVVGKWAHLEMMDDNNCWVRLGNATFNVHVSNKGTRVTLTEGTVRADGVIE